MIMLNVIKFTLEYAFETWKFDKLFGKLIHDTIKWQINIFFFISSKIQNMLVVEQSSTKIGKGIIFFFIWLKLLWGLPNDQRRNFASLVRLDKSPYIYGSSPYKNAMEISENVSLSIVQFVKQNIFKQF